MTEDIETVGRELAERAYRLVALVDDANGSGERLDPQLAPSLRTHVLEPLREAVATLESLVARDW